MWRLGSCGTGGDQNTCREDASKRFSAAQAPAEAAGPKAASAALTRTNGRRENQRAREDGGFTSPQLHRLASSLHAPAPLSPLARFQGFHTHPFTTAAGPTLPCVSAASPTSLRRQSSACVPAAIRTRPVQMLPTRSPLSQHQHHWSVNSAGGRALQTNQPIRCQVLVATANQRSGSPSPTS